MNEKYRWVNIAVIALMGVFLVACEKHKPVNSRVNLTNNGPISLGLGVPIKWSNDKVTGSGLDLKIADAIESEFAPADYSGPLTPVEVMGNNWNNVSPSFQFFRVPANRTTNKNYSSLSSFNDSEMGIYKSTIWFDEVGSSALAITQFYGIRRNAGTSSEYLEMIHADIIFNYRDFTFSTNANDFAAYDFYSVILHELGHFIGLPHQSTGSSVMQPYLAAFDSERTLYSVDANDIIDNYTSSGSSSFIATMTSAAHSGPSQNNQVVRGIIELKSDGECNHYIDGEKVYSH